MHFYYSSTICICFILNVNIFNELVNVFLLYYHLLYCAIFMLRFDY